MTPQELKNSILQLAIQGKLVEQREEEGNAEDLYAQIQAEKQRLIAEKKIKKQKPLPAITDEEKPFEIPESWKWVRLEDIVVKNIKRGKSPTYTVKSDVLVFAQKCNTKIGTIDLSLAKYLDVSKIDKYPTEEFMMDGDIILNSTGNGTLGRVGIYRDSNNPNKLRLVPDSHVTIIRVNKCISLEFVFYCLKYYQPYLEKKGSGSTNQTELSAESVKVIMLPLPPLAEQQRIVAKIEELLPQIDRYEQAWSKLEQFNARFPEDMKKSLLQYAIQGKLVEQRPEEGNAEDLYAQIQAEKQRLIAEKKIKKQKPLPEITDDEKPFEIPESWKWVRLGEIVTVLGGKRIPAGRKLTTENTGYKYIRVSDMKNGTVLSDDILYVPKDIYPTISRYIINKEDVYITVAGTIGRIGKIPEALDGANLTENADRLVFSLLDQDWLIKCLESDIIQSQIINVTTKVGQPKLAIKRIQDLLIPLPPFAEQKRIVEKLEQLLPLCEQLK
ncbi:MAG: restriction endonuclease subunit S [Peptococcaceae bacterium]|nr:restriction endonuclease subunit S [Peptococcaceae bacterium]